MSLGAIPVLSEVMVATRGATDAFSGVQRHVNNTVCVTNIGSSLYVLSSQSYILLSYFSCV